MPLQFADDLGTVNRIATVVAGTILYELDQLLVRTNWCGLQGPVEETADRLDNFGMLSISLFPPML